MPDKQLTIATYAAGASLAAITLVYVFGPTFFIDGDSATSTSSRKKGVVGLVNPANDCFINAVLQALAGLGDLRLYLIRETHRRKLDGPEIYAHLVKDPARQGLPNWKIQGLQAGMVTFGLKAILDALNERPLQRKAISAAGFVGCLESAFKQRISRQQQDAQEFLQIVLERLCDEYHAGHRARNHARRRHFSAGEQLSEADAGERLSDFIAQKNQMPGQRPTLTEEDQQVSISVKKTKEQVEDADNYDDEEGFPLEGVSESQIECLTCGFKPKPTKSNFCSLTLSVPQVNSTSLSACFDQMFKTEYIDDFKCEKCRLLHALNTFQQELARSTSEKFRQKANKSIDRLQDAIKTNPEDELKDIELPDIKFAPKRKIAKHVQITKFPKAIAIHLSRSIFEERSTMKNSAKVSFPERLPLGGLLDQRIYKLLSVVCHKGSHHSGHYESFRRQILHSPFSTPNTFQVAGVYSKPPTPIPSQISTPQVVPQQRLDDTNVESLNTPELLSPASAASPSQPLACGRRSGDSLRNGIGRSPSTSTSSSTATTMHSPTSAPRDRETSSIRSGARAARASFSSRISSTAGRVTLDTHPATPQPQSSAHNASAKDSISITSLSDVVRGKRKKSTSNRWWRISDDKIKESKTSDVLSMQKEVYLLFYELNKGDEDH